jgi:hypothetical protein
MPSVTIRTVDDQTVPVPMDGVLVQVFSSDGETFVTSGVTTSGEVELALDGDEVGIEYLALLQRDGSSFLPSPSKTIVVTDPSVPPYSNEFEFVGHEGLVGQVVTLVINDSATPTPSPVEGVTFCIFSYPEDAFLAELESDEDGEAQLVLDGLPAGKEYLVRVTTPVGYLGPPTRSISVVDPLGTGGTNIFDFVATLPSAVPVSPNIYMCRLSGYFYDPSLSPLRGLTLMFHPREGYPTKVISGSPFSGDPTIVNGFIVASEKRVVTDSLGYVEFDLPRTGIFDVYASGLDAGDHTLLVPVYIPDVAGISIHEVLFPYLTQVTYSTSVVTLAVGESEEVEVELTASNYQPITSADHLNALVAFTLDDSNKAVVAVTAEGKLLITAVEVGSATLSVARVDGTSAPRRPEIAALIVSPSVLTVTVT